MAVTEKKTQRIRDPVHGLIVFDKDNPIDQLAWRLVQTPEFQRLQRIKQLGFSEFVYPGATHSRFAHSIGVYHNARKLMNIIKEELRGHFDQEKANITLLAALLHDLGHGPFSHAFEKAREGIVKKIANHDAIDKHEVYTEKIIINPNGEIYSILEEYQTGTANNIGKIIRSDNPEDIYHAVVSSSFDADRLDYFERDRYMTGTYAGAIDKDWLEDNLVPKKVKIPPEDDFAEIETFYTLAFRKKARQAAEDFLLARHRLYSQVYYHKTTRGFEVLLSLLLTHIGEHQGEHFGLSSQNPLIQFLKNESLEDYLKLDDLLVWDVIRTVSQCTDNYAQDLAQRIWDRKALPVIDLNQFSDNAQTITRMRMAFAQSEQFTKLKSRYCQIDKIPLSLYTEIGNADDKQHKKIWVDLGGDEAQEISKFEDTVISPNLKEKRETIRLYFLDETERDKAEEFLRNSRRF